MSELALREIEILLVLRKLNTPALYTRRPLPRLRLPQEMCIALCLRVYNLRLFTTAGGSQDNSDGMLGQNRDTAGAASCCCERKTMERASSSSEYRQRDAYIQTPQKSSKPITAQRRLCSKCPLSGRLILQVSVAT